MIHRFVLSFLFVVWCHSAYAAEQAAKVIKAEGEITATNEANEQRTLTRGSDVFSTDTIITPSSGFVTLRFNDGSVVDLAEKSKYVIKDYHFDKADPKKDSFKSEIIEGGFRAISGEMGSRSPTQIQMQARMTTLTIRGTYFYLMAPPCPATTILKKTCSAVSQFTVEGTTALTYKGKDYVLGPHEKNVNFTLDENGVINLSDTLPSTLPSTFRNSVSSFPGSVGASGGGAGGGGGGTTHLNGSGSSPTQPCAS